MEVDSRMEGEGPDERTESGSELNMAVPSWGGRHFLNPRKAGRIEG